MSTVNKMVNAKMTVVELKAAAKARGFKRYSKLRKAELLHLFDGTRVGGANENIIDASAPNIKVPTLTPSPYVPASYVQKFYDMTKSAINQFANWIVSYIPPEPKRLVNEKLEALKQKYTLYSINSIKRSLNFERVN